MLILGIRGCVLLIVLPIPLFLFDLFYHCMRILVNFLDFNIIEGHLSLEGYLQVTIITTTHVHIIVRHSFLNTWSDRGARVSELSILDECEGCRILVMNLLTARVARHLQRLLVLNIVILAGSFVIQVYPAKFLNNDTPLFLFGFRFILSLGRLAILQLLLLLEIFHSIKMFQHRINFV